MSISIQPRKMLNFPRKHLKGVQAAHEAGFWAMSGAYMSSVPKDGEPLPLIGSAMIALAASKEEVMEVLRRDIYALEDAWDMEKVQIWPFRSTVRSKL
jgi:hypothetical protein